MQHSHFQKRYNFLGHNGLPSLVEKIVRDSVFHQWFGETETETIFKNALSPMDEVATPLV